METCQVGMFKLPGLKFPKGLLPEDLVVEMSVWCKENNCGTLMHEEGTLWSFRNEGHRDWFVLRWSDLIPKPEIEE
jgi:hypothetical protein